MAQIESSLVTVSPRRRIAFAGTDSARTVVWMRGEHDTSTVPTLSGASLGRCRSTTPTS